MLKIKDSVNLKELKKFGFTKRPDNRYWFLPKVSNNCYIIIPIYSRIINVTILNDEETSNLLYDLIQAGLVEKV